MNRTRRSFVRKKIRAEHRSREDRMNVRLSGIILVVMVSMVLSACGGGSSGEGGFGTYVFTRQELPFSKVGEGDVKNVTLSDEEEGARFEFVIPAPEGNALVAVAETHRAETGAGAVSYILASLDNTEGSIEEIIPNMRLTIITTKGDSLKTKLAWEAPDGVAAPGESTTTLLMTDEPIPSVNKVFVEPVVTGNTGIGAAGAIKLEKVR